jgi:hypothetical protein
MKEAKKSEDPSTSRSMLIMRAFVQREKEQAETRRILAELEDWLLQRSAAHKALTVRFSRRFSSEVQQVITNRGAQCISTSEDTLAAQLLAGKNLSKIVFEEQNGPEMKRLYDRINFSKGVNMAGAEEDRVAFKELDAERAAIQILKAAIPMHKKKMISAVAVSMQKFSQTVAKFRSETAREILAAMAEMRRIVEPDQELATGLDRDEIEALRPKPFPMRILSTEAISWLLDAVSEKIIEKDELNGVQPEELSPTEGKAEAAPVSWLNQI